MFCRPGIGVQHLLFAEAAERISGNEKCFRPQGYGPVQHKRFQKDTSFVWEAKRLVKAKGPRELRMGSERLSAP